MPVFSITILDSGFRNPACKYQRKKHQMENKMKYNKQGEREEEKELIYYFGKKIRDPVTDGV